MLKNETESRYDMNGQKAGSMKNGLSRSRAIGRCARSCGKNEQGAVALMFGFLLPVLIGFVMLSVDLGRVFLGRTVSGGAADAASISAAMKGGDMAEAEKYFLANLQEGNYGIGFNYASNVDVSTSNNIVQVTPTGFTMTRYFNVGQDSQSSSQMLVSNKSAASMPNEDSTQASADYFIITDVSGSMDDNNEYLHLQDALLEMFNRIKLFNQENPDHPARATMTAYGTILRQPPLPLTSDMDYLISRIPDYTIPPTTDIHGNPDPYGDNTCGGCGVKAIEQYLQTVPDKKPVNAVLLFTDGLFNAQTTDPWRPGNYVYSQPEIAAAHAEVQYYCDLLKQDPSVTIWSISYGTLASEATLRYCADNDDQFLYVTTPEELIEKFLKIVTILSKLLLVL